MNTIKDIAAIIGCILSLISLITLCTKGGREAIKRVFNAQARGLVQTNEQQNADIREMKGQLTLICNKLSAMESVQMQQCRNTIKNIYYKYYKEKRVPLFERKTVDYTYKIYNEKFHGNSYAQLLYEEIAKWEVIPGGIDEED